MNYIKVVAILFSTFHIQTSANILSTPGTSIPAPSPDANLTFYATVLAAIIGALVSIGAINSFFRAIIRKMLYIQ
jgi:hypothetical protein